MDVGALATIESQVNFCHELVQKVVSQETFIILSGESGSGRTVVCEQVVNQTDSKMHAVFIPCHKDMQLQRLRELFLSQLIPGSAYETNLNLADALQKLHIPHNHKILVVVDDVDTVVSAFYNELVQLYEQFLGQSRFAFILVAKPLWAEEKASRYTGKADLESIPMPRLNMKESMVLSRHIFALQNTMRIYNAIVNKLPTALAAADGNIGQIISISEKLMKDPNNPQIVTQRTTNNRVNAAATGKKKSSSVGIFVTIVCIIIVLACLIPIFFGGNFFSSSDNKQTQAQVSNDGALVFDKGANNFDPSSITADEGVLPGRVPQGTDADVARKQTEHSVTLSDEQLKQIEGGANNSGYPRSVGGSVAVLRREDNLNHVNQGNGHNTALEAPAIVANNTTHVEAPTPSFTPEIINDAPTAEQIVKAQQDRQALQAAAQAKLEADRKQAQAAAAKAAEQKAKEEALAKAKAEQIARDAQLLAQKQKEEALAKEKAQAQAKQQAQAQAQPQQTANTNAPRSTLKAGQVINLGDEQRQQNQAHQVRPFAPSANTVTTPASAQEGTVQELSNLPNQNFTVQIVSASNINNIRAAARGLNTKFWIVPSNRNGRPWYILVAGNYASRAEAVAAANNIPPSVSQGAKPFAKQLGDVKTEIRN